MTSRREVLQRFSTLHALVVGDVMVDEYIQGDVSRISPDAPVPVLAFTDRTTRLGGASNVANNLVRLGARATLVGCIGADTDGAALRELATAAGIDSQLVESGDRPTTRKTRVIARNQQLIRIDAERTHSITSETKTEILRRIQSGPRPNLIVLSDYGKGVLSMELLAELIAWATKLGIPTVADPKKIDFKAYRGATFITPNAGEAAAASGLPTRTAEEAIIAGIQLLDISEARGILLTRGEHGMALVTKSSHHLLSTRARQVFDVTGAGDTVLAVFGLSIAAGAMPEEAMALANHAAGIVVGRVGVATCTREEIAQAAGVDLHGQDSGPAIGSDPRLDLPGLMELPDAVVTVRQWREAGRRVVFTNGCFDILHAGHVILLEEARSRGDALIVGLNTDESTSRLKGPTRPIQKLRDRARVLGALRAVDLVVPFGEDTPFNTIMALRPDVLVKGGDYQFDTIVGAREVQSWGGEVVVVPQLAERSTSLIIERGKVA